MSARWMARSLDGIDEIAPSAWNSCLADDNPFLSHAFLRALEESGSVGPGTGWRPRPLLIEEESGNLLAAAPLYEKAHSLGEYIFDHAWAEAYARAGARYYPKLQLAIPFSPVPGPRLLVRAGGKAAAAQAALIETLIAAAGDNGFSSLHVTFCPEDEAAALARHGFLRRLSWQYHWRNENYRDFADFLDALNARKRKAIRKERAAIAEQGIEIESLSGAAIRPQHWDALFAFYQDTGSRKWGRPYLNRAFFAALGEALRDRALLILARHDGRYVAGALNLRSATTLYGRYWGALADFRFLHFECCYYRAIDYAIAEKLTRVEAGAQGEHKIQRGYLPVATHSAHWIADPDWRTAIADFLARETPLVERQIAALRELSPFRKRS